MKDVILMTQVGGRRARTREMALDGSGSTKGCDDGLNVGVRSQEKLRDNDQSLT